ncbi:MAG TPA: IPT/TIG domain-containing protein [Candidatus Polarisedimenticolia bacterium]|nr:IPT/TIG domain-containing protein [Candidatus Polarisedimenticolia bacterium]
MVSNSRIPLIGTVILILGSLGVAQQNQPLLQISSPVDGTIVNPGQAVTVLVASPAGVSFSNVTVVGADPIGISDLATSVPAQFSINIPSNIECGRHILTALGVTASGSLVQSATINLDVERPDMPVSLSSQFQSHTFEAQGQTSPMMLLATFSDGSSLEVTGSSKVTYQSTNATVVNVDATGAATAVATGNASLVATYQNPSGPNLQISIPVTVLPFEITLAPNSLDFGTIIVGNSVSRSIVITNSSVGDSALSIKSVGASGPYSETDNCVSTSPLALDGTCTITVTFNPTAVGQSQGTLSIDNSSTGVSFVVPLTGSVILGPVISSLLPFVGPSGTGTRVTIAGSNFGSAQGNSTVAFNQINTTPDSWSAGSIVVPVPAGLAAGNVNVSITVNGGTTNPAPFTVIPSIASVSVNSGAIGTPVTISGTSFGAQGTNTVTFNGVASGPTTWSDTSITAPVPTGATTGPIIVTVNGLASNSVSFTVNAPAPTITSLSPTAGPIGSPVTITGTNFGDTQNGTVFFTQANHALVPAPVTSWSATSIGVTVPSGAATGNVKILLNNKFSNAIIFTVTP